MSDTIKLNPALAKLDVLNAQTKVETEAKVTSPVAAQLDALADRVVRLEDNAFADNLVRKLDIPDIARPDADAFVKVLDPVFVKNHNDGLLGQDTFVKGGGPGEFYKGLPGLAGQPTVKPAPDTFVKEGPSFWKVIDGINTQPNPIPGGIEPGGDDGLTPPTGIGPGPMPGPVSAMDAFRHLFSV